MARRNILVFQLGALGDFVLTWPLMLGISRIHPQSRVIVVTHAGKGKLAERAVGVESADIEAGWHHLYGEAERLPEAAGRLLANAHSVYSFIANEDDAWTANVRRLAPWADVCCLRPTPHCDFPRHATEYVLEQLSSRPAVREAMGAMVRSIESRGLGKRSGEGGAVMIHPGSGSAGKCWPGERFVELARRFRAEGRIVRVLLGEVESELWEASRIEAFAEVGEVRRLETCMELFEQLASAGMFIGNDSGPTHLAGMMGVPTFCLFGPTNPATWRPLGPKVSVLHRQPMEAMVVDEVWELISHG